jgi:hypothetical protein
MPAPPAVCAPVLPILDGVVEAAPAALARRVEWETPFGPMPERPAANGAPVANVVDLGLYQRSKAQREYAEAAMALDELARRRAQLIDAGDARKAFAAMGRMYAQGRESVPLGLAPQLVGLTDLGTIENRIRAALRDVDQRISTQILSEFAEIVGAPKTEEGK